MIREVFRFAQRCIDFAQHCLHFFTKPHTRRSALPFDSVEEIPANEKRSIVCYPQVAFRLERLIVPSDIAGAFIIREILVGEASQFAAPGPIPARVFSELAVGVALRGDACLPTMPITIVVETMDTPARFRAAGLGLAVN